MYNSSFDSNRDEADLTMVNLTLGNDHIGHHADTEPPTYRRPQQINQSTKKPSQSKNGQHNHTTSDSRQDYMFVDYDRQGTVKQIEQILNYYRRDLKQETNTQLDCDRHLVTRLVDFIRPAYSSDQKKINDLDALLQEIGALHDKRHVEQQEKNEQLQHEIRHFKKLIITAPDEDENRYSTMTNVYRMNSMVDYEEWMEVEEETKRLYNLIELQRNQINQLIEYMSQEGVIPSELCASQNTTAPVDRVAIDKQQPTVSNATTGGRTLADIPKDSGTTKLQRSTDDLHSPGTSPIHSLTDFLTESPDETSDDKTNTGAASPPITNITLRPISHKSPKRKCRICNYEFPKTLSEREILNHVEKCSSSSFHDSPNVPIEPELYTCPNCSRKFPHYDEETYHHHLSYCYNGIDD